jgi:2-polyprenyl-3-methyl-5-hydroxy-6-metoxy-1,4-benzoquinol methylase
VTQRSARRRYDTEQARATWDFAAESFDGFQQAGNDFIRYELFGPAQIAMCGEVAGLDVLDMGCGNGYFSREMARRGARVTAVDLSPRQIELALRHEKETPLGISYQVMDAQRVAEHFPAASFDLVTACLSLGDMPEPPHAIHGAYRVLRPGGRFVVSITHPVTDVPLREWDRDEEGRRRALKIGRYFDGGVVNYRWRGERMPYEFSTSTPHFTLAQWLNWFIGVGFAFERFAEPCPSADVIRAHDDLGAALIPEFLLMGAVKPA